METPPKEQRSGFSAKLVASAIIPPVVLGAMIAFLLWPGNGLQNIGIPLPDVTIERVEFLDGMITAYVRNTGPQAVDIAQADVNDRIVPAAIEPSKSLERFAEARVVIPFRGQLLIATAAIVSFLALMYVSDKLVDGASKRRVIQGSFAIALMVAIGIGLHNLGEGLAIGGAMVVGEVALSTFLIVGFTLHNTTEGLAIVAPMAKEKPKILYLVALGIIAGAPAIAGTWIGGFVASPVASIVFLAIGAGAVFQVVVIIGRLISRSSGGRFLTGPNAGGLAAGMLIMYLTTLLI